MIMLCDFGLLHTIFHHTFIGKDMLSMIETVITGSILSFSAVLIVMIFCVKLTVMLPDDMVLNWKNVTKINQ